MAFRTLQSWFVPVTSSSPEPTTHPDVQRMFNTLTAYLDTLSVWADEEMLTHLMIYSMESHRRGTTNWDDVLYGVELALRTAVNAGYAELNQMYMASNSHTETTDRKRLHDMYGMNFPEGDSVMAYVSAALRCYTVLRLGESFDRFCGFSPDSSMFDLAPRPVQ